MEVKKIKGNEFKKVISKGRVVVDCYASWCGPCKMMSPIFDEVASQNTSCTFYKLDVDDAIDIAKEYEVFSIPTLLLFEDGKLINRSLGLLSKEEMESFIQ